MGRFSTLVRAAVIGLAIFGTVKIVTAQGVMDCERLVGEADIPGQGYVVKDTGLCQPNSCPGLELCDEIAFPGIPFRFICNCGMTGNACTVMYAGQSGGSGGSASCYNNSCQNPCPAPQQKTNPDGGYVTFTFQGNIYYVLTCPCP